MKTLRAELSLIGKGLMTKDGYMDLKLQGVRSKLGVRGVFRAVVFAFMAAVRLMKGTPIGRIAFFEAKVKLQESKNRGLRDRLKVSADFRVLGLRAEGLEAKTKD